MQMSHTLQKISDRISWSAADKSLLVKVPIWNKVEYGEHVLYWLKQNWIFNLDKNLRTNKTFDYMAIYINYLYFCNIGFVEVKSFGNSKSNTWTQIYCGVQSTSMCFPPHRNVEIGLLFEICFL